MVGVSIYGLWEALSMVKEAIGLQMSIWGETSTFTAITVLQIGIALGYAFYKVSTLPMDNAGIL